MGSEKLHMNTLYDVLNEVCLPHLKARLEDGKGNRWQKDGRASLFEVKRDGRVFLPATTTIGLRYLQELRGSVACRIHGRQRCCDVGKGRELRAQGGCFWRW